MSVKKRLRKLEHTTNRQVTAVTEFNKREF